ncbi:MAG TPA: hypothetical protein VLG50_06665 [Candidatus Saccharimonadales bacterium]|nr:hypothetical protein [Candidatus Saccharimonadales bacterium]
MGRVLKVRYFESYDDFIHHDNDYDNDYEEDFQLQYQNIDLKQFNTWCGTKKQLIMETQIITTCVIDGDDSYITVNRILWMILDECGNDDYICIDNN